MSKTVKCQKCGHNFRMGKTGTVNGCDKCTGAKRDGEGNLVPGPGEVMVHSSIQVRCICGQKHWFRALKKGKKEVMIDCLCGAKIGIETSRAGLLPFCAIDGEINEWQDSGHKVVYPLPTITLTAWRCEICQHIYKEPFSDEKCECFK